MAPLAVPCLLAPLLVSAAYRPSTFQATPVQPTTYRSPSGAVELFVDPSRRSGNAAATYRQTRAGLEVWEVERPFTFLDARVLEDGTAAGYGVLRGRLVIAVLAPDGGVRAREDIDRHPSRWIHAGPEPRVRELVLASDGGEERFLLRAVDSLRGGWELAFDGTRIALRAQEELALRRADGSVLGRAALPERLRHGWPIAFSPEGDELWVFASAAELWRLGMGE